MLDWTATAVPGAAQLCLMGGHPLSTANPVWPWMQPGRPPEGYTAAQHARDPDTPASRLGQETMEAGGQLLVVN